ncbi:Uma2 family endonuclease [Nocardia noduli]|uniref:Uma2 family endonuclease n=1 Tax=Nocardia noduli TaxID=2815722 RepID=UPI001C243C50|nr:Uma2 family endonuclease [Nocardia noduli]
MSAVFDWAREENLQPELITVEVWRELPEEFCRLVEIVNGEAVRAESPSRPHQTAARRLTDLLDTAITTHRRRSPDECLDVNTDFDVLLWEAPRTTIRRPDIAVFECAPADLRPLPAHMVKLAVEIVSPGTSKVDLVEKKAEYAVAGIPWYWIVWVVDDRVSSIEIHVLDHTLGQYRPHVEMTPTASTATIDLPIRVAVDWSRLDGLTR